METAAAETQRRAGTETESRPRRTTPTHEFPDESTEISKQRHEAVSEFTEPVPCRGTKLVSSETGTGTGTESVVISTPNVEMTTFSTDSVRRRQRLWASDGVPNGAARAQPYHLIQA